MTWVNLKLILSHRCERSACSWQSSQGKGYFNSTINGNLRVHIQRYRILHRSINTRPSIKLRLYEQLITILEDVGVAPTPQVFLKSTSQGDQKARLNYNRHKRSFKVCRISIDWRWNQAIEASYKFASFAIIISERQFLNGYMLEAAVLIQLRTLKYKARIPVKHGFASTWIIDETRI